MWPPHARTHSATAPPVTRVLFRENGSQRSETFGDHAIALRFKDLVEQVGPDRAKEIAQIESKERKSLSVADWITHHIDHLASVDQRTPRPIAPFC